MIDRKTFHAILDGTPCTAKKTIDGKTWLIGGDVLQAGQSASILIEKDSRPAWHTLKGCVLIFSDFASRAELDVLEND